MGLAISIFSSTAVLREWVQRVGGPLAVPICLQDRVVSDGGRRVGQAPPLHRESRPILAGRPANAFRRGTACAPRFVAVPRYGGHARAGQALPLRLESRSVLAGQVSVAASLPRQKRRVFNSPAAGLKAAATRCSAALLSRSEKPRTSKRGQRYLAPPEPDTGLPAPEVRISPVTRASARTRLEEVQAARINQRRRIIHHIRVPVEGLRLRTCPTDTS